MYETNHDNFSNQFCTNVYEKKSLKSGVKQKQLVQMCICIFCILCISTYICEYVNISYISYVHMIDVTSLQFLKNPWISTKYIKRWKDDVKINLRLYVYFPNKTKQNLICKWTDDWELFFGQIYEK